ncbi:MAG: ABC transporter substrate binding protein [Nitrospira sp.]
MDNLRTAMVVVGWVVGVCQIWHGPSSTYAFAAAQKVIVVVSQDSPSTAEVLRGFRTVLESGGVHTDLVVQNLNGNGEQASAVLHQFKSDPPALFLTVGSLATQALLAEHVDVPVIASLTAHLEKLQKRDNLIGVSLEFSLESQLVVMRRILPDLATVGVLYSPKENQDTIDRAGSLVKKLGLKFVAKPIEAPRDIPDTLEGLANNVDLLWGIADQVVLSPQMAEPILLFSFRNKVPLAGLSTPWVKAGALYALERDYGDIGAQCAEMALKILNKTNPQALSIVAPRKVLFSVNLKTARVMRIELPQQIIDSASHVFQ